MFGVFFGALFLALRVDCREPENRERTEDSDDATEPGRLIEDRELKAPDSARHGDEYSREQAEDGAITT
jgi:hypothetical protein